MAIVQEHRGEQGGTVSIMAFDALGHSVGIQSVIQFMGDTGDRNDNIPSKAEAVTKYI